MGLEDIDVTKVIEELENISGVRVFDEDLRAGIFYIGMELPDGKSELTALVEIYEDRAYFLKEGVPETTPPSYVGNR
ncbi:hypothetical protein FJZ18_04505 [Candidatus Pacearchaeota archaeon]|nr:hypothetical protein [Candidatus Pacearchaeota archaeon]